MGIIKLSDVEVRPPKWFWYPYLMDEAVNLIGGESGTGKTWFLCALMAAVTTGEQPDGMPGKLYTKSGKCLYYGGEDGASTLADRCKRQGVELSKVAMEADYINVMTKALEDGIEEEQPDCVIIDPLISLWPPGSSTIKGEDVRRVMDHLRRVAEKQRVCLIAVVHPGKNKAYSLDNRFAGSRVFVDVARSATYIGWHPRERGKRVGYLCKTNAEYAPPFQFSFDKDLGVLWEGESDVTRKELEEASRLEGNTGGNTIDEVVRMVKELIKMYPEGCRMKSRELSKALNSFTPFKLNPYAFGKALNSELLAKILENEGITLRVTKSQGNKYYSLYPRGLI